MALRFMFALSVSFCLMVADYRFHYLNQVRQTVSLVASPIQYAVNYPMRLIGWIHDLVSAKTTLIDDNIRLRYQQTLLEAKLQKLMDITDENTQLKKLLSASPSPKDRVMAAEILAVDTTDSRHIWVINKGRHEGVFEGQPVLDANGIVGQIIDGGIVTSTVMLISDIRSGVPVRNNRTGEQAILTGTGHSNQLTLINLPKSSSIALNDLLVTSGLGLRYPEGYPVGKIKNIASLPGEDFMRVTVQPIAQLDHDRMVLLMWPGKERNQLITQINERIKPSRK